MGEGGDSYIRTWPRNLTRVSRDQVIELHEQPEEGSDGLGSATKAVTQGQFLVRKQVSQTLRTLL